MKALALALGAALLAPDARALRPAPRALQEEGPGAEIERTRERGTVPETLDAEAARAAADRALGFLVRTQKPDGSWGSGVLEGGLEYGFALETFYAWQLASHALACMALLECEPAPERQAALDRALDWLCATRLPKRGDDWDVDYMWPALYGFVAAIDASGHPRVADPERRARVERRGRELLAILLRNQVPEGGWAYYDDPPYTRRPKWATSFCTALVLPSLARAEELGWLEDPAVRRRATAYVERCALPGGAYEYDLNPVPRISGGEHINRIKGSLGRTQVCNWALASVGVPSVTPDKVREGLEAFFEHHRFLDVARMRPIPHEAYYANAGYFYFFGHHYAARAILLLPEEEREAWHARLRPHLAKTLREGGSTSDFLASSYMITGSTAFAALALSLGLPARSPAR